MGRCVAFNCNNSLRNGSRLFRFPRDDERKKKWKEICQRDNWEPNSNSSLCEEHFDKSQYELHRADGWIKLKPNAIPVIPSISSANHLFFREKILDDFVFKNLTEDTAPKCIISNCTSTYLNCSLSFFEIPSTYFRHKWSKVIRNSLRTLNDSSVVCSKHFLPEDFIHSLKKKYLKGSAVPSVCSASEILTDIHERNPALLNVSENEVNEKEGQRDIICRICAQSDDALIPIYGEECSTNDIPGKIVAYLPTTLAKDDRLSQLICRQCVNALISWHVIYQRALNVSHMMQAIFNETESDSNIETTQNIANIIIPHGNEEKENDSNLLEIQENSGIFEIYETELTLRNPEPEVEPVFQCDICGKLFQKKRHLKRHIKLHEDANRERTVKCDFCPKLFRTIRHAKSHAIIHEFQKKLNCNLCEKSFEGKKLLKQHIKTDHDLPLHHAQFPDDKKSSSRHKSLLQCMYCNRTFTTRYWLNIHVSANHKNGLMFVCEVCDQEFCTEQESKAHIESENHKIDTIKSKKCTICGLEFESRLRYRRHQAENHDIGFACNLCPLVLETPEELLRHSVPHPRRKYFKCEYCQKNFTSSSDFRKHERIHTGHPRHLCDICGKKFIHKTKLVIHSRLHYIDQKYICSVCGTGCLNTKEAREHRKLHSVKRQK